MKLLQNVSIQRKQTLIMMVTSGVALLLACLAFATYEVVTFRTAMISNLSTLAEIVGNNSAAALDFNDRQGAEETLSGLRAESDIIAAAIYNRDGAVFAVYDRSGREFNPPPTRGPGHEFKGHTLVLFRPIARKGDVIGTVFLESDLRALYARLQQYLQIALGVFCLAALVSLVLSARLQRMVSGPILNLLQTTRNVANQKDFSMRAVKQSGDELGALVDGFNEMLDQIQQRDAELQKAKDSLEQRVEERTDDLQRRTEELDQEILQHKRAQEALAVSEHLMVSLVETLPQNVLRKDLDGRFTFVNGFFCHTVGKSKEEILGKTDLDLFPAHLAAKYRRDDQHVIATGKLFEDEEEHPGATGERSYAHVIKTLLRDTEQRPIGLQVIFWDVTARRQAEQAVRAQEERTRLIIDQAFDSVVTTDIEGRIIGWNRQAQATFGWAPDQIMGRKLTETVIPPRNRLEREADFERFHQTGEWRLQNQLFESTGLHQDGREIPIEISSKSIFVGSGHILNIFIRDISARKKAEAELAYERDLLKTLMDNSPEVIYFKDLDSRFVRFSKSLAAMFHLADLELLRGKTDFDVFTDEHARPAFEDEQAIIRSGQPVLAKVEKETHVDGRVSWALTSKLPWRDDSGKIVGTFGISQNITSMKEAEAKLEAVHKQLLDVSRQAGMAEVATSVLHNVGNVLNSINVTATLAEENVKKSRASDLVRLASLLREHEADLADFLTSDPRGRKVVAFIVQIHEQLTREHTMLLEELAALRKNVEHIKEIVAMQQSYARISGVVEPVEITQLLEDALRMNAAALTRHQVQVVRQYSPLPPVSTEKHKVLQILVNLVSNAKYACDQSGRSDKRIVLRVADRPDRVKIMVMDNGIGIALENLTRIFNLGFTTRKNGHGFGLHSSALAAQALGGSLTAQSEGHGGGAVFTLELPRQPLTS